jgi:hypothetical protein
LEATFGANGKVSDVAAIESSGYPLEKIVESAYNIKFTPARRWGQDVTVRKRVVYRFWCGAGGESNCYSMAALGEVVDWRGVFSSNLAS